MKEKIKIEKFDPKKLKKGNKNLKSKKEKSKEQEVIKNVPLVDTNIVLESGALASIVRFFFFLISIQNLKFLILKKIQDTNTKNASWFNTRFSAVTYTIFILMIFISLAGTVFSFLFLFMDLFGVSGKFSDLLL